MCICIYIYINKQETTSTTTAIQPTSIGPPRFGHLWNFLRSIRLFQLMIQIFSADRDRMNNSPYQKSFGSGCESLTPKVGLRDRNQRICVSIGIPSRLTGDHGCSPIPTRVSVLWLHICDLWANRFPRLWSAGPQIVSPRRGWSGVQLQDPKDSPRKG